MVKKQEYNKSYAMMYRIFIFEYDFHSTKYMFTGNANEAVNEFKKIQKSKGLYGGVIYELDDVKKRMYVFRKIG